MLCQKGWTLKYTLTNVSDKYIYCLPEIIPTFTFSCSVLGSVKAYESFPEPCRWVCLSFIHVILWLWGIQQCQILAWTVHLTLTSIFPVLEYMNLEFGISQSCLIVIPEELFSNTAVYCVPQDKLMHLFQLAFLKNNFY